MDARSVVIRPADPAAEREAILAVLERNLPRAVQPGRHDWLYLGNPRGRAFVWVAEDPETGAVVGTSAAHVRRMRVRGEVVDALNLGDFAIDRDYRALGPALRLLRATLAPVDEGRFAFSYDHPNDAMQTIYRRLGGVHLGRMRRLARPVSASAYARRRWGPGLRAALLGRAGDAALRLRDVLVRPRASVRVSEHEGPFAETFTAFDEARAGTWPVSGARDAEYLTWRFHRHPLWRHRTLVATRAGALAGYAVYRADDHGSLDVVELCGLPDRGVVAALLAEMLSRVRESGGESLVAQALAGSAAERFFRGAGFHAREEGSGAIPYAVPGSPLARVVGDPSGWWMVEGDRDV
jgi:hypothetical protein